MNKHKNMVIRRMWVTLSEAAMFEEIKKIIKSADARESTEIKNTLYDFFEELISRGDLE